MYSNFAKYKQNIINVQTANAIYLEFTQLVQLFHPSYFILVNKVTRQVMVKYNKVNYLKIFTCIIKNILQQSMHTVLISSGCCHQ